ncbi:MAG: membrane protein insertase YidC [Pseudomonadota bacterium]|jgi:YidC/Oxa1 family membrane protein insertase
MQQENPRNMIAFVAIAFVLLTLYSMFVLGPAQKKRDQEALQARATAAAQAKLNPTPAAPTAVTRTQALAQSPRSPILTPALRGSIDLRGGRLDDLYLRDYHETLDKKSPPVELFRPEGSNQAYFADFGWTGAPGAPNGSTLWTKVAGEVLDPDHPVTLAYDNGQGLVFTRTIAVDKLYMFTITDQVANKSAAPVQLAPYASVQRQGKPQLSPNLIIHEGAVGAMGEQQGLNLLAYKDFKGVGERKAETKGGWTGLTDKYWLAAVIPDQGANVTNGYRYSQVDGVDVYEANYIGALRTVAPGAAIAETRHLFAGAKKVSILKDYEARFALPHFIDAVDWGNLWFLTKPVFYVLSYFAGLTGNFGVAILLLTLVVKIALFPLAQRGFQSASRMKQLQPKLEEIRKAYEKDPAKQQQETMALYQREKVNPLAGCLPILVQLPVFYSLYKVLFVSIEMRQAPFFGWVHDLSAPDPTTFLNLFGLIPWNPALTPLIGGFLDGTLHIGVWPLLYGVGQWLSTSMTPQPSQDPTQKIIFQLMPAFFVFLMAKSPSGLLIYWSWSSALTIAQQYVIMHRAGVENPIDAVIQKLIPTRAEPQRKQA